MEFILVKFSKEKSMVLVSFFTLMEECLKENLKMISKQEKVMNNFQMGQNTQDNLMQEPRVVKELFNGQTEKFIKVNG
jgi:hypothetical protein